jgi:putative oxidoreductase
MADSNSFTATWAPRLLSVLRIVAALLMMQHGAQKFFGYPPPAPSRCPPCAQQSAPPAPAPAQQGLPPMILLAAVLELFGGLALLLGLFTRLVAFVLSGLMAAAYFIGHATNGAGFWPVTNGGELAALYCFVFLYLAAAGPGPWSLDAMRERRVPAAR